MGRKNPNATQILADVHESMKSKFLSNTSFIGQEIAQAKEITSFLQILKERAYTSSSRDLGEDLYDMILNNIVLPNGRTLHNLFRRIGRNNKDTGQKFEDDLAAVLASIVNLANLNKKRVTYKNFSLGSETGTTDIFNGLEQEIAEDLTIDLAEKLAQDIKDQSKSRMGKIDTMVNQTIVNINAKFPIPDSLLEALSNATFTDKSYRSIGWDKKANKTIDLGDRVIHLGNSSPYKAILGSMSSLGFSRSDAQYIYYAGRNIADGNDFDPPQESPDYFKLHIYHLRYLYELTGAGIIYQNFSESSFGGAKFLVYNDPNSMEILCVSTAQIISQLLQSTDFPDNPYGNIGIAKAALRKNSS